MPHSQLDFLLCETPFSPPSLNEFTYPISTTHKHWVDLSIKDIESAQIACEENSTEV
jgi:hypothetical protein